MVVECAEVSLFCWVVLLVICYIINFLLIGWWENVFLFPFFSFSPISAILYNSFSA